MKITKAKLVKGTYLEVSYADGNAVIDKSFPHTEAPPKLLKAFISLNHHVSDLTEQYDKTGQPDYENYMWRDDPTYEDYHFPVYANPILSFKSLWDKINGEKQPWHTNPWVWVVSFKVLSTTGKPSGL